MPTITQRFAMWRVYKGICAYDNLPIDSFAELEIDHIIPQHLLQRPQQLETLLARIGEPSLDLNSYNNWLPVHGRCNRDKSGEIQPDAALYFFLGVARRHEARARAEELRLVSQSRSENHLASIAHLIEKGELALSDVFSVLNSVVPKPKRKVTEIREIRWSSSAVPPFIEHLNPGLEDIDKINSVLMQIRDNPHSAGRSMLMHEQPMELKGVNQALYVARADLWRVYYTISKKQLFVVHIEKKKNKSLSESQIIGKRPAVTSIIPCRCLHLRQSAEGQW